MKTALVTGAYKGLGLEWCRQLAQQGYKVLLTAREQTKATEAARMLEREGLEVIPKNLDVTNENELHELALWIEQAWGQLDLIINNAGINPKDYHDKAKMAQTFYLDHLNAQELFSVLHINSIAPLMVVKHMRQLLKKSSHPMVINISSWLGSVSTLNFGGHYGYTGSKNLLNIFNKSMSMELKEDEIICLNINPGWVKTDMGGPRGELSPQESVTHMLNNIVFKASLSDSGKFLQYDGSTHPW